MTLSESDIKHLKTMQGNTMERVMGINNRSHHSNILKALGFGAQVSDLTWV